MSPKISKTASLAAAAIAACIVTAGDGHSALAANQVVSQKNSTSETSNLHVTTPSGAELGLDPNLAPATTILVVLEGFAPAAAVDVRLVSRAALPSRPRADDQGVLRFLYRVPDDLAAGQHLLTFSGEAPTSTKLSAVTGNVTTRVPNIGLVKFHTS